MKRPRIAGVFATTLFAFSIASASAAAEEKLDVVASIDVRDPLHQKATATDPLAPKELTVPEGTLVQIYCSETIRMLNWTQQTWALYNSKGVGDQGYQTLVQIDGATVDVLVHVMNKNKDVQLGTMGGKFHGNQIDYDHPAVYWVATGIGNHEIRCVANWQKTIPDNEPANSVALAIVRVKAAKKTEKPSVSLPAQPMTEATPVGPGAATLQRATQTPPVRDTTSTARPTRSGPEPASPRRQPVATRATVAPAASSPPSSAARALDAADCLLEQGRPPGHYVCPTQAGLDRCERLLAAGEVSGCRLGRGR